MSRILELRNRQRVHRVRREALVALAEWVLSHDRAMVEWELGIHLIGARTMAAMHQRWLGMGGSTDIITFDHGSGRGRIHGEMFISVDDAAQQAAEFGTSVGAELARYVIHGILHLQGFDDLEPAARRRMKARENAWVRRAAGAHDLAGLVVCTRRGGGRRHG